MGSNNNFKKAWEEIKSRGSNEPENITADENEAPVEQTNSDNEVSTSTSYGFSSSQNSPTTLIAQGTKIEGSITTTGPLQIDGEVKGNILKTDFVTVNGIVTGDIVCNTLKGNGSKITGSVTASNKIDISNNGSIVGDINTNSLTLAGVIQGNISAKDNVEILSTSKVTGDIAANTISIEKGALIDGRLSIQPSDKK